MKHILIAGGSGLVGQELAKQCLEIGHKVTLLSRNNKSSNSTGAAISIWNPEEKIIDIKVLQKADIVINLAGESIAKKRWTAKRKKQIINSRVVSNNFLVETILENEINLEKYISASAIGYYGNRPGEILDENSIKGNGFLPLVCEKWEATLHPLSGNTPYNILRFGMVLSKKGGALSPMKKGLPIVSPYFAKGNQYISWIHLADLCEMLLFASTTSMPDGVINAVAPQSETAANFAKKLGQTSSFPTLTIAIPALLLRSVLGEMADLMLDDTNVSSSKIEKMGFTFKYPSLEKALEDLN